MPQEPDLKGTRYNTHTTHSTTTKRSNRSRQGRAEDNSSVRHTPPNTPHRMQKSPHASAVSRVPYIAQSMTCQQRRTEALEAPVVNRRRHTWKVRVRTPVPYAATPSNPCGSTLKSTMSALLATTLPAAMSSAAVVAAATRQVLIERCKTADRQGQHLCLHQPASTQHASPMTWWSARRAHGGWPWYRHFT